MIFENEIQAKIRGDILVFQKIPSVKSHKFTTEDVEVFRGGDWKIKGDKSVFHYKVKIKNNSEFVITNLQVVLGGVPPGLVISSDKLIEFSSLNPMKEVAPTF